VGLLGRPLKSVRRHLLSCRILSFGKDNPFEKGRECQQQRLYESRLFLPSNTLVLIWFLDNVNETKLGSSFCKHICNPVSVIMQHFVRSSAVRLFTSIINMSYIQLFGGGAAEEDQIWCQDICRWLACETARVFAVWSDLVRREDRGVNNTLLINAFLPLKCTKLRCFTRQQLRSEMWL